MADLQNQAVHPADAALEVVKSQVFDLRIAGASYRQIASTMTKNGHKISAATAYHYVKEMLAATKEQNEEKIDEVRRIEIDRLDQMLMALWPKREQPRVADTMLRLNERRSRLLGLDAPTKIGLGDGDGGPVPIAIVDARGSLRDRVAAMKHRTQIQLPAPREAEPGERTESEVNDEVVAERVQESRDEIEERQSAPRLCPSCGCEPILEPAQMMGATASTTQIHCPNPTCEYHRITVARTRAEAITKWNVLDNPSPNED